jgi:hypothetical protein
MGTEASMQSGQVPNDCKGPGLSVWFSSDKCVGYLGSRPRTPAHWAEKRCVSLETTGKEAYFMTRLAGLLP